MRIASILILSVLFARQGSNEPGAWLDSVREWQFSAADLRRGQSQNPNPQCDAASRVPQGAAERLLATEGWKLSAASVSRRDRASLIEVVQGFRQYDGMCRPLNFQTFVFVNERPIGTLSPRLMNSREDGALQQVSISDPGEITATFLRYSTRDALCCASRESRAVYSVVQEAGNYKLKLLRVETKTRVTP
jgi:hypothetical protein